MMPVAQLTIFATRGRGNGAIYKDVSRFNSSLEHTGDELYLEIAPVIESLDGSRQLGAAQPLQRDTLSQLGNLLSTDLMRFLPYAGSLGNRLLLLVTASSSPVVAWYCPPGKRLVRFLGQPDATLNTPALVFVKGSRSLTVFGVATADPAIGVTPETPLCHALVYNVDQTGKVCIGSVRYPDASDVTTIDQLCLMTEQLFWSSNFSAVQHSSLKQVQIEHLGTTHKVGSLNALWSLLTRYPELAFPEQCLVPTKFTVAELLKKVMKGMANDKNQLFDFEAHLFES